MREWKCARCLEQINIFVPDSEKKYIIDGDKIFCSKTCCSAHKQFIPLKLSKDGRPSKYKKGKSKPKKESIFKCFHCNEEWTFLTWDKLCHGCRDKMSNQNQIRIKQGEFLTDLIGGLTSEQRSLIRLTKIN